MLKTKHKKIGHIILELSPFDVSDIFLFDFTIHSAVFSVQMESTLQNYLAFSNAIERSQITPVGQSSVSGYTLSRARSKRIAPSLL